MSSSSARSRISPYLITSASPADSSRSGKVRKVSNRVIFMDQGSIVEDATKEDFFGKPRSERAQQFLSKILSH